MPAASPQIEGKRIVLEHVDLPARLTYRMLARQEPRADPPGLLRPRPERWPWCTGSASRPSCGRSGRSGAHRRLFTLADHVLKGYGRIHTALRPGR